MLKIDSNKVILIHHWDTDGLCSAALLLNYFKINNIKTWTPPLGTFYLTDDHIEMAKEFDNVIVCDMALPESNIRKIAEESNVIVIDHHHQDPIDVIKHINPIAWGASTESYPSCTWVIKNELELPTSLKVILGIVGDREHKIKDNPPFWELTRSYMKKEGVSFDELLELVYRIDSSYKIGEREAVMRIPHILKEYKDPTDIIRNREWENNLKKLDEKLKKVLSEPPEFIDGIQVKMLNTSYSIISQVTRKLAWDAAKDTIVVNTGFFDDQDQFYSRSNTVDMHNLIERAQKQGYNAGGKKDVLGAIIPKPDTGKFLLETIEYLKKKGSY